MTSEQPAASRPRPKHPRMSNWAEWLFSRREDLEKRVDKASSARPISSAGGKIAIVEVIRGLAALAVAWFHLTGTYPSGWVRASGSYGWLGVDAFFVISGFVVPYSIHRGFATYTVRDFPRPCL